MAKVRDIYSKSSMLDYFHRTSGVQGQPTPDEVQTNCPMCGSDKLYFNIKKLIGVCHSASCEWHSKVFVDDLIEAFGFSPAQGGEWEREEKEVARLEVVVPGNLVLCLQDQQLMSYSPAALEYLRGREIPDKIILNWELRADFDRVYVPISDVNGTVVNYNSRLLPAFCTEGAKKYLYSKGAKTGNYILGWVESRDWEDMALVENTYVSLAYRDMHCTTTFGSNVSDVQADLIADSGCRTVAILWDENAEQGADRSIKKLHERGVKAAYWKILGQPDDYDTEWVKAKLEIVREAARSGKHWVDFREECKIIAQNPADFS